MAEASSATPKARSDVVLRQMEGEWVLFDPSGERIHVLNATAGVVWTLLDGTRTHDDLVADVRGACDPPPSTEQAATDVAAVLRRLADEGLLE